jgi:hypothetical protein
MGTKFRTLLAPIGLSTGDGRRFAEGGITLADTPFPFEWARQREGGHDGAVGIGVVNQAKIMTIAQAIDGGWIDAASVSKLDPASKGVFGQGELFDDVNREEMPRLAEDVAEAMHLIEAGTLGPSVDLDSFEAKAVMAGTDEEITYEELEAYYEEHGTEPPVELLITQGRVRAGTLVSIPAFAETSAPLELIAPEPIVAAEGEAIEEAQAREATRVAALVASVQASALPAASRFERRDLAGPTPATWDFTTGEVYGHLATWGTCHVGIPGTCITPPHDPAPGAPYSWFNRYAVETDEGTVWAGRITVGGRHAEMSLAASAAMAVHDGKTTAAWVRAYEDEHGIAFTGVIEPGLTPGEIDTLNRRKVSGDWREASGELALVEILALGNGPRSQSEPGFPVLSHTRHGRQTALVACLGPEPEPERALTAGRRAAPPVIDTAALARAVVDETERRAAAAELAGIVEAEDQARGAEARAGLAAMLGEE